MKTKQQIERLTVLNHEPAVYVIRCTVTGQKYVGASKDVLNRFYKHGQHLRGGCHRNKLLQAAWNTFGHAAFEHDVLEYTDDLVVREAHHIREQGSLYSDGGFNLQGYTPTGKKTCVHGKRTPEQRERISKSKRFLTDEQREEIHAALSVPLKRGERWAKIESLADTYKCSAHTVYRTHQKIVGKKHLVGLEDEITI